MDKLHLRGQTCPIHQEPLTFVCLDESCERRGMICSHCEFEFHDHPIRPLGAIIWQIERDRQTDAIHLLSQVDQVYSMIVQQAEKVSVQSDKSVLMEMINRYYQSICEKLNKMARAAHRITNKQDHKTVKQMNGLLLSYEFCDKADNPTNLPHFEMLLQSILLTLKQSLQELKEGIKEKHQITKILPLFDISDEKKANYFFSEEKKHKDITVASKKEITISQGYTYRVALLDPPIHKENASLTKKKSCTFKCTKINSMVGIGVVFRKKCEDLNYVFSAYSQHGCYFMANNGYVYNEFDSNFNSQVKGWTFLVNELVTVTIDPKSKKISFTKEGSVPFEYNYEEKANMELNFGVMVCSSGETIEVL